jgi:diaminopimelate epimerase
MPIPFRKMHGAGNDFVIVDARAGDLGISAARIAALADRNTGIGFDQFITLQPPPPDSPADVFMRIHNADGSQAGACGNATRCVAALLHQETGRGAFIVQTIAGALATTIDLGAITVDMGPARLHWNEIPLAFAADTLALPIEHHPAAISMGNPHATLFVADIEAAPITTLGPLLENSPIFPDRANIGFAQILAPDVIRLRVWERGAGLTRACGSGACAALVNAVRLGLADHRASLLLDGGTLTIEWRPDGHVLMSGPAETAFTGQFAV